jgi:hypothetical protein
LTGALSIEHVTSLRKLGPTPEEFEAFKKYTVSFGFDSFSAPKVFYLLFIEAFMQDCKSLTP